MSFNLVDLVKDQVGGQLMSQLGGVLGGSSDATSNAVGGAIPALLKSLTSSGSGVGGADALFNAVQDQDDGILGSLGDLIGGGADSEFSKGGTNILGSLLGGGGLGDLAGAISSFSGLARGSSGSLLGMLAPIVLSVIKRKVLGGGLNARGMMDMLEGQGSNIDAALPKGLSDALSGSSFLGDATDTVKQGASAVGDTVGSAANTATETAKAGGGMLGKLIPLLLLGALAFFGLKMCGQSDDRATVERTVVEPEAVEVERTVVEPAEVVVAEEVVESEVVETTEVVGGSVAGTYAVTQTILGKDVDVTLTINEDGTGSVGNALGALPISGVDIDGNGFTFASEIKTPLGNVPVTWDGIVDGDNIVGSISGLPAGAASFTGTRN